MASVAASSARDNSEFGNFITRPEDLAAKIAEWNRQGAHVLAPTIQISSFAPGYGVNPGVVYLDTTVDDKGRGDDVYYDKTTMALHERGPGKIGLGKLASAAGVSWIGAQSGRRDPLTIQNLWIYQVVGVYLANDGTPQVIHGEKEIDYRDGSAQIGDWSPQAWRELLARDKTARSLNSWSETRVRNARMNGAERAETGAMERAIRMGFGIKHIYTLDELARPFIALRMCALVDTNDPDVRRMVTANKLAGVAALYAGERRADVIDISTRRDPVPVGASSTVSPVPSPAVDTPAHEPNAPPVPTSTLPASSTSAVPNPPPPTASSTQPTPSALSPANLIREVKPESKPYSQRHAKAGQSFLKYHVIDGNGVDHVTIKSKLAKEAQDYRDAQTPCILVSAMNGFRELELSEIQPFTEARPAALPAEFKL